MGKRRKLSAVDFGALRLSSFQSYSCTCLPDEFVFLSAIPHRQRIFNVFFASLQSSSARTFLAVWIVFGTNSCRHLRHISYFLYFTWTRFQGLPIFSFCFLSA